jgi:nitrite reductase (NADH) small subunit
MPTWKTLCKLEDIPKLGARRVTRASGGDIAVFRAADDHVFAMLDSCPHKGGPLSQGIVFGHSVACPLHNWTIDLESACALAPDEGCVQRFTVQVEGETVSLDMDELAVQGADPGKASKAAGGNDAAGSMVETPFNASAAA